MKVLVVDDEPDVRVMLRHMLESQSWAVHDSESAELALEQWQQLSPDIVVTDNLMPGMTGIEFAVTLRERGFAGPVLLFSAYLDKHIIQQAKDAGVLSVSKVDTQSLIRVLRAFAAEIA